MKLKNFLLRMLPVLIIVVVTIIMSAGVYSRIVKMEEEVCWDRLENATSSTADKIKTRMKDNQSFLQTLAEAYVLTHNIDDLEAVGAYLDSVVSMTIFERIDVILPDESLITQGGETAERGGESSYEELLAKGAHITQRRTSSFTGKEVICCVAPITDGEKVHGLLVGTISCDTLNETFEVFTYGEEAQLYLIDCTDGNYLMDNWHETLGNIYELGPRKSADSDEMLDFVPTIINRERGRFAFISRTNGEISYQYCAPVDGYNWEVCVVVQEDVAFTNANELKDVLFAVGLGEFLLILLYVVWNAWLNMTAVKNERKIQHLEYETAKNDARSKFISNMSHDIKTPLNGIVGMVEIIKNHRKEDRVVDDCLQKIEISARYLSTLTSDMLDVNEMENNKLVLQREPVDLQALLEEVDSMMERQAGEAGVSYTSDYSGLQNPYILGSGVHIKRILVNLIGNAVKYSKHAGKQVWVSVVEEEMQIAKDRKMYRFIIKDNGIGMSEEFQKNMYKAFEQETIDARSEYQGYGLGLTIVNYLIKKMKGTIELESAKGVGSTFTVSIPLPLDTRREKREQSLEVKTDLSGMKILLVEDNEFNMEIANILLSDAGAGVDMAIDGKLATELFAASEPNTYDIILMDIMMPVMDGCEAAKAIRAMERPDAASIPIIAMTASTFSEDVKRCKDAGMNVHVPKPLDVKQLMTTIMQLVKQ